MFSCFHSNIMTEEQELILPIHLFVVVSSFSLWIFSIVFQPTKMDFHVLHMMGIVLHYFYYVSFGKLVWIMFNLFSFVTIMAHVGFLEKSLLFFLVLLHVLHHGLLFSTVLSIQNKLQWILIVDTFSKNLYMTCYLLNQNTFYIFPEKLS